MPIDELPDRLNYSQGFFSCFSWITAGTLAVFWGLSVMAASAASVPPEILALADKAFMTPLAREIFFAGEPQLVDRKRVTEKCKVVESFIVQGCFADGRIFLHKISDARLRDSMINTAAHEMLHAAYEKMKAHDRSQLDRQIASYVHTQGYGNFGIKISQYKDQDEKLSELHSILGTEIESLPRDLEQHYALYFRDRAELVRNFKRSKIEIESRQTSADLLEAQAKKAKPEIMSEKARIQKFVALIKSEEKSLNALKKIKDVEAFNALAEKHNGQVEILKTETKNLNLKIDHYNGLVKTRNDLVGEIKGLYEIMDGN